MRKVKTTITEEKPESATPGELEGWLSELSVNDQVARVSVQRKNASGVWAVLPRWKLEPPFDRDLLPLYEEFGDGDYRFAPTDANGRYTAGAKVISIEGFGSGKRGAGAKASGAVDMSEMVASMRESLDMTRMMLMQEQLQRQMDRLRGHDGQTVQTGYVPTDPMENLTAMTTVIANIVAAITPKQDNLTRLVEVLITRQQPQETTKSLLDSVGQVLDLKDRLGGPEPQDMDWKTLLMMGLFGLGSHPAIRAKLDAVISQAVNRGTPGGTVPGATATATPTPAGAQHSIPTREPDVITPGGASAGASVDYAEADQTMKSQVWPLIKRAIAKGSMEYGIYADLIEDTLPGFLDTWISVPFETAITWIEGLDVSLQQREPATIAWLRHFYDYVQSDDGGEPT